MLIRELVRFSEESLRPVLSHGTFDDGGSLRQRAKNRAQCQCNHLCYELLPELELRLHALKDETPEWLGQGNAQTALDRIREMLKFLSGQLENDGQEHNLLCFGDEQFTTPALLAVQALLYSHTRWGAECFHDIRSAKRTEELLSHFPQWIRECIASIVGWINPFRTSFGPEKESGVWNDGELSFDDDKVAAALASVLRKTWTPEEQYSSTCNSKFSSVPKEGDLGYWRKGLLKALSLVAAAYENRVKKLTGIAEFSRFVDKVGEKINGPESDNGILVVYEYSHYVVSEHNESDPRKQIADVLLPGVQKQRPNIMWVSFSRYWATHHGSNLATLHGLTNCFRDVTDLKRPTFFGEDRVSSLFFTLDLDDRERAAFHAAFGAPPPEGRPNVWELLNSAVQQFLVAREKSRTSFTRGSFKGMPWAFVMRALDALRHIYEDSFFRIKVRRPEPCVGQPAPRCSNPIWLPRDVPEKDELEEAIKNKDWRNPKLLVARCFATLLINQSMVFGNARQILDTELKHALIAKKWYALGQWVASINGYDALERYLEVFASPNLQTVLPRPSILKRPGESFVLGIDIGGNGVKMGVYKYLPDEKTIDHEPIKQWSFGTARIERETKLHKKYKNMEDFVKYIDDVSERKVGEDLWKIWKSNLVAVGITWPGAVAGELGYEYIASFSQVLANFQHYCTEGEYEELSKGFRSDDSENIRIFYDATAKELHELKLREAIAEHFFGDKKENAPVVLLNDGAGHVIHSWAKTNNDSFSPHELVIVLAAGTGTAMGAVKTWANELLDVLAEVGKAVTDIGCECNSKWPNGTGGHDFSKKTIVNVAQNVLEDFKKENDVSDAGVSPGIDPLLIGYLLAADNEEKKEIRRRWDDRTEENDKELDTYLDGLAQVIGSENTRAFAEEVARQVGVKLADLTALSWELFHASTLYVSGGPMSGSTGEHVQRAAKDELRRIYGFHVVESLSEGPGRPNRLWRRLRFIPKTDITGASSGSHGAAVRATELLASLQLPEHGPNSNSADDMS